MLQKTVSRWDILLLLADTSEIWSVGLWRHTYKKDAVFSDRNKMGNTENRIVLKNKDKGVLIPLKISESESSCQS